MSADSLVNKLTAFLDDDLERTAAAKLACRLAEGGHAAAAFELLTELREGSRKVASAAVEALPEVVALLPGEAVVTWIDLAVSLNEQSGAASIKFCKESAGLLQAMDSGVAGPALAMALELAEQDANVALEGFRQAAGVVAAAGVEALLLWGQIGADHHATGHGLVIPAVAVVKHLDAVSPIHGGDRREVVVAEPTDHPGDGYKHRRR